MRVHSWVVYSLGFHKCIMTCFFPYYVMKSSFTPLRALDPTLLSLPRLSEPLATTDVLTVSIVLPFPECHIVGIIQYIARLAS